jgi:hypothetical protein
MGHRKAERVSYQIGIQDFWSSDNPRLETKDLFCHYSVQKQNSEVMLIVKIPQLPNRRADRVV